MTRVSQWAEGDGSSTASASTPEPGAELATAVRRARAAGDLELAEALAVDTRERKAVA